VGIRRARVADDRNKEDTKNGNRLDAEDGVMVDVECEGEKRPNDIRRLVRRRGSTALGEARAR